MKTIRWTIIGSGGIADRRAIPALLTDPQNEIVAVMDRKESVAKAIVKGKTDYANAQQALHIQKLCDQIYQNQ